MSDRSKLLVVAKEFEENACPLAQDTETLVYSAIKDS